MPKAAWRASRTWTAGAAAAALDAADSSGLSDERFAEREGLNPQRLYYWRRKLDRAKRSAAEKRRRAKSSPVAEPAGNRQQRGRKRSRRSGSPTSSGSTRAVSSLPAQFIEVQTIAVERIEVQLRNGRLVSAPATLAPATLAALLDAIEGFGC
jgi:hypothetical protein